MVRVLDSKRRLLPGILGSERGAAVVPVSKSLKLFQREVLSVCVQDPKCRKRRLVQAHTFPAMMQILLEGSVEGHENRLNWECGQVVNGAKVLGIKDQPSGQGFWDCPRAGTAPELPASFPKGPNWPQEYMISACQVVNW